MNNNKILDNSCKMKWLDDIFLGTSESQGIRNATSAVKFVLFDDESVLPKGIKYSDKYEFISARRDGRKKSRMLDKIALIQILCKYSMQSFGIRNISFALDYDDYLSAMKNDLKNDYTSDYAVQLVAFSCLNSIYETYSLLSKNKNLCLALIESLINERYIENKMLMLDRFDGMLLNDDIKMTDKEKFLDNFKLLDDYFKDIRLENDLSKGYLD